MNRIANEEADVYKSVTQRNLQEIQSLNEMVDKLKRIIEVPKLRTDYFRFIDKQQDNSNFNLASILKDSGSYLANEVGVTHDISEMDNSIKLPMSGEPDGRNRSHLGFKPNTGAGTWSGITYRQS